MSKRLCAVGAAAWVLAASTLLAGPAPDSRRLAQAKDYIADEQWARAIAELQVAASDPKETHRDEALFWLAHSEHQTGDDAAAIETITKLERQYPRSPWVRIAASVRVEIAQRLRRDDVLWRLAVPPPAPPAPRAGVPPPAPVAAAPPAPTPAPGRRPPSRHAPPAMPPEPATPVAAMPSATPPPSVARPVGLTPPVPPQPMPPSALFPAPTEFWVPNASYLADTDLRIEALRVLLDSHGDRAIPLLREIALDRNSPDEARRAVFVLAQSHRVDARNTVRELARRGAEPVRLAAIREIGRFDGPSVSAELMQVYSAAPTPRIKRQIVSSLGERADSTALLRIAKAEADANVRDVAIVTLGRTGAREQIRTLYLQAPRESRVAVLTALFNAKDEDELIRIAQTEREPILRVRARQYLRLLATPKALKFLEEHP